MKKIVKIIAVTVVALFVTIQFFQPESNDSPVDENHILRKENVTDSIQILLKNACFDCHSGQTDYPWYDKIAPASWLVANHIKEGKRELNFSEWGKLDTLGKISALGEIQAEIESGKMPLRSYTLLHRKARLSDEQVIELTNWTENLTETLLPDE